NNDLLGPIRGMVIIQPDLTDGFGTGFAGQPLDFFEFGFPKTVYVRGMGANRMENFSRMTGGNGCRPRGGLFVGADGNKGLDSRFQSRLENLGQIPSQPFIV